MFPFICEISENVKKIASFSSQFRCHAFRGGPGQLAIIFLREKINVSRKCLSCCKIWSYFPVSFWHALTLISRLTHVRVYTYVEKESLATYLDGFFTSSPSMWAFYSHTQTSRMTHSAFGSVCFLGTSRLALDRIAFKSATWVLQTVASFLNV